MPFQPPRPSTALASALAAAGIVLTVASCSRLTPLGPDAPAPLPPPRHLGSPIILQVMRTQPPPPAGRCPAGWVTVRAGAPRAGAPVKSRSGTPPPPAAASLGCYRPVGTPVTITSAGISPVSRTPAQAPPGQPPAPAQYGFTIAVPAAEAAAVTALISQAYHSRDALGVSAAGKLWQAPQVAGPFPGQQLQVAFLSRDQALQLYRILVPPS